MRRLPSLRLRRSRLSAPVPPPPPPPPPDFQGLESNWRPAGRVFIAAAGLALVVALAITLTLALPESDANAGDATPPNQQADAPQQSGGNNGNDGNNPGNGDPEDEGDGEDGADPPRPPQGGAQAAEATGQAQAQSTVTLTVGKIAKTTATLTIDGHSTAWYYQADVAPDNTCKGPVAANVKTKDLSGLAANTTYTYTAYSDSGCATQVAAASPFTTGPWLNVIDVNDTTAKLFLSSSAHTGNWYYKADAAPDNTCQGPAAQSAIHALTGLTASTTYTYTAYSDSACTTKLVTASPFTTYAFPLDECHDLTLEMYITEDNVRGVWFVNYRVGNRTDETLTNVKVVIQSATPFQDGTTGSIYYKEPVPLLPFPDYNIVYRNDVVGIRIDPDEAGSVWELGAGNGRADRSDWAGHWEMPTMRPAASHSVRSLITEGANVGDVRIRRNTATMTQLAADGTELCKTERVYWTRSFSKRIAILNTRYGVALSVDERHPKVYDNRNSDTVNFKVGVNVKHGYGVNARVTYTSGLAPPKTPTVTQPAKTTWQYHATKPQGDFFIGTEEVGSLSIPGHSYEITLPMQVKQGATVSEQCVTVTVTGLPETTPRVLGHTGDDPSDNRATVCLGRPPLFHEDGDAVDLWTVYPCVGTTTHPCNSADTVEIASVNKATGEVMSGARNKVNTVIKIDPVAGAIVDTYIHTTYPIRGAVHTYKDANDAWQANTDKVSWVTKRTCPTDHDGNEDCSSESHHSVPGVAIRYDDQSQFAGETGDWHRLGLVGSVSGVGLGGLDNLPAQYGPGQKGTTTNCATATNSTLPSNLLTLPEPPGDSMVRLTSGSYRIMNFRHPDTKAHRSTYPRHKRYSWRFNKNQDWFPEFAKLGTYVMDFHGTAKRSSSATDEADETFCDTLRTVFHVGPVAELGVWDDGDANPDLSSSQVAYTLNLDNAGPDPSEAAQVLVELPADATSVTTLPAGLGSFHAAATVAGVSHGPYWLWNVGELPTTDTQRTYRRPQGREVTLVVGGATAGDTATATVSNGNGHCKVGTTTLPHVIRTEDCAAINADTTNSITTAAWTLDNPYTLCLNYDSTSKAVTEVLPKPAGETACEGTTANPIAGNSWHAGTVLDHHQGNNVATLTARAGGGAGLAGVPDSETVVLPSIDLNWPMVAGASEYRVFRSADGKVDSYSRIAKVKAPTATHTDAAVTIGTTYYYLVEALDLAGRSVAIYTTSATATAAAAGSQTPGTVRSLTAARQKDDENTIDVTWTGPSGSVIPTGYDVENQSCKGSNCSLSGDWSRLATEQAGSSYTLSGAGGGTKYQFRVRAINRVGNAKYEGSWQTSGTVPTVSSPNQVGNLTATRDDTTKTTINVGWNPPATNGTAPTHYEVQYQQDGGSWEPTTPDRQEATAGVTDFTYQLTNATGASTFRFRVRTATQSGNDYVLGSWRTSGTVAKLPAPGQAQNLTATRAANETIIDFDWDAPAGSGTAPTHYDVQYQVNGGSWTPTTPDQQAESDTDYQLTGAVANSSYRFRVRSVTVSGTGDKAGTINGSWAYSNTVPRLTAPSQVGNLTATRQQNDETKIDVTWTAPTNATGATRYDVQYKEDNDSDWTSEATNLNATNHQLTGAAGGSRYVFRVRGVTTLTGGGNPLEGSWRQSSVVRGLPAADVTGLSATRMADPTKIEVTWDVSARATGYDVQYRQNSGSWRTAATAANQTATSYTHENAGGVETYQFRVRGVSDAGNGAWTESGTVQPPPAGYHGADVGVDYITLKVTSGPWWFDYRDHKADWSSCKRVASGNYTLTNLRATTTYLFDLYESSGCSADQFGGRQSLRTLSDVYDWTKCWNVADCRDIDSPNDMSRHTHKRSRLAEFGVTISGCDWSTRETHTHGWPDGGYGAHWHCKMD